MRRVEGRNRGVEVEGGTREGVVEEYERRGTLGKRMWKLARSGCWREERCIHPWKGTNE
jgi:hypothetical protein